ncbi:MAG: amidohydrolase family protein [Acidimicrobiia bacterium]
MEKIWVNSGDSHFTEPDDLWARYLPAEVAERMPRSVKDPDGAFETVHVDGQAFRRPMPKPIREGEHKGLNIIEVGDRPPGARDVTRRLADLDEEGIWAEVCFPSLGLWSTYIRSAELARAGAQALNRWAAEEIAAASPRLVPCASLPLVEVGDAVAELERCAGEGFHAVFLPVDPPEGHWNEERWGPLWAAAEACGVVVAFHIGTDRVAPQIYRNPGGAILNYVETTYGGQRAAAQLVANGTLARHPGLRVLVAEGGATWAPFLGDRLNEGYRQHAVMAWPKLEMLPKEYIYRQVYCSFQHDVTAIPTLTSMGYRNVMFGSDYPHLEGTFGHTQATLRELFDGQPDDVRYRITIGSFLDLFPHVGPPPQAVIPDGVTAPAA